MASSKDDVVYNREREIHPGGGSTPPVIVKVITCYEMMQYCSGV